MPRVKAAASDTTTPRGKGKKTNERPKAKSTEHLPRVKGVGKNIKSVVGHMKSAVHLSGGEASTSACAPKKDKEVRQVCEKCKKRKREAKAAERSMEVAGPSSFFPDRSNSPYRSPGFHNVPYSSLSLPAFDRDDYILDNSSRPKKHSLSSLDRFDRYIDHLQKNDTPITAYKKSNDVVSGIAAKLRLEHRSNNKIKPESRSSPQSPPKAKKPKPNLSPIKSCGIYALSGEVNPKAYDYTSMTFFNDVSYSDSYTSLELPSDIFDQTTVNVEHDESMSIIQTNKSLFIGINEAPDTSASKKPKKSSKLPWKRKSTESASTSAKRKMPKKAREPSAFDNPFKPGKEWQNARSRKMKQSTPVSSPSAKIISPNPVFKSPEAAEPKATIRKKKNVTPKKPCPVHCKKKPARYENFNCNSNSSSSAMFEFIVTPPVQGIEMKVMPDSSAEPTITSCTCSVVRNEEDSNSSEATLTSLITRHVHLKDSSSSPIHSCSVTSSASPSLLNSNFFPSSDSIMFSSTTDCTSSDVFPGDLKVCVAETNSRTSSSVFTTHHSATDCDAPNPGSNFSPANEFSMETNEVNSSDACTAGFNTNASKRFTMHVTRRRAADTNGTARHDDTDEASRQYTNIAAKRDDTEEASRRRYDRNRTSRSDDISEGPRHYTDSNSRYAGINEASRRRYDKSYAAVSDGKNEARRRADTNEARGRDDTNEARGRADTNEARRRADTNEARGRADTNDSASRDDTNEASRHHDTDCISRQDTMGSKLNEVKKESPSPSESHTRKQTSSSRLSQKIASFRRKRLEALFSSPKE